MSAFSAFGRKVEKTYCFPEPGALRKSVAFHSSVHLNTTNAIHTPDSIIVGLNYPDYLLVAGCYHLTLRRGQCLMNSIHRIPVGQTFSVSSDNIESIPTISVPMNEGSQASETESQSDFIDVLPEYDTLVEIGNENNGMSDASMFSAQLMGLHQKYDNYTFKVVSPSEKNSNPSILIPNDMTHALNSICENLESVAVFGVANSGKQTFAKALINCLLLNQHKAVAYLDIDPSGSSVGMPYSLSLRIHTDALFGSFHLIHQSEYAHLEKDCYYGYSHCYEMPEFYITQCKRLIKHHRNHVKPLNIPLIVKYPSWIKGLGKEVLKSIHDDLAPKTLVYCRHENSMELNGFQPENFEVEHSESEMLGAFKSPQTKVVNAVRKGVTTTKQELRIRNTLLYLHQRGFEFDFQHFLIDKSPNKLPAQHVAAVSVLNFDTDVDMKFEEVKFLAEATLMGLFVFTEELQSKLRGKYLNGSDFVSSDPHFIGLCVVHSVSEEFFCIYVNNELHASAEIKRALAQKKSLVLARGEGQIPTVEFEAHGLSGILPYIGNTRHKLGGTWEVRRNIVRKTK